MIGADAPRVLDSVSILNRDRQSPTANYERSIPIVFGDNISLFNSLKVPLC